MLAELAFDQVMLMFLKHSQAHKRSYAADLSRARALSRYFRGRNVYGLAGADIDCYIQFRQADGVGAGGINRELMLLSAALSHAAFKLEKPLPNPVRGRLLSEPPGRVRWISREESERLIQCADSPALADFIRLALHTGCRSGELMAMEWARVDFQQNLLHSTRSTPKPPAAARFR